MDEYETRLDIRTLQFGVQYLYCFNYGKFSLKAPFVMNERQKKSAGSFVAGAGIQMYILDADSALSLSLKTMNDIGYNGMRIFGGLQLISNYYFMPLEKNLRSSVLEGRSSLYFGYGF